MGFDAQNFGIGMLAGWASAYAVYRYRHVVSSVVDSARARVVTVRSNAALSADSRYSTDLINRCETTHLAGQFVRLTEVLVEPRFLRAPEPVAPAETDVVPDSFDVVPRIHDLPYLHAPYNLPTIAVDELADGPRALALLGLPGSGRTTALQTIALYSLNRVRFSAPTDVVQRMIEEEEARLTEKERLKRAQERLRIEAQAREKLAQERGVNFQSRDEAAKQSVPLFYRLMPVYIHLAFFEFEQFAHGEVDPAEPLVSAVQASVGAITRKTIPGNLYDRLEHGQVLLLLDGLDDLPPNKQTAALVWLEAFMNRYGDNFVIAAGPAQGFGGLVGLGLTPIYLRPWQDVDVQQATEKWAKVFARLGGRRMLGARKVEPERVQEAREGARALTPLEVVMKTWHTYLHGETGGLEDWYIHVISRHLPNKIAMDKAQKDLSRLAELQINEGYITRARMVALGIADDEAETPAPNPDDALREELAGGQKRASATMRKVASTTAKTVSSPQAKFLAALTRSGLLVRCGRERYRFRHHGLASYLASLTLHDAAFNLLYERASQPHWRTAVACAALHMNIDKLLEARLNTAPDVLHWALNDLADWLKYAPQDALWRGHALRQITTQLSAPNQYPLVRERAAAALVAARDPSALFILRKAARSADPSIRSLACLTLGATGNVDGTADLKALAQDRVVSVRMAAGMALGVLATEDSMETLVNSFHKEEEIVRKALAETFAALPDAGHPILYEAVRGDDMLTRRAAIAGIRRIRASWAFAAIYRAFLLDTEWYVRSAAEDAFIALNADERHDVLQSYPPLQDVPWLVDWARRRGEILPTEENALDLLLLALRDSEPQVRELAAGTLGQLGALSTIGALYQTLTDNQERVRARSFDALGNLQLLMGRPLPSPGMA